MWVDGLSDLDGERDLADEITRAGADDAPADHAVGLLRENQLGEPLVATVRNGAPGGPPGKLGDPEFDALFPCFLLCRSDPRDLRIGVGHRRDHARVEMGLL